MNSEQVNEYLAQLKNNKPQSEEKEPITPETPETPKETPPESVDNKAEVKLESEVPLTEKPDLGVEQKPVEDKADDKAERQRKHQRERKQLQRFGKAFEQFQGYHPKHREISFREDRLRRIPASAFLDFTEN